MQWARQWVRLSYSGFPGGCGEQDCSFWGYMPATSILEMPICHRCPQTTVFVISFIINSHCAAERVFWVYLCLKGVC